MTPVLKTSRRLLLSNVVRYTFPKTAVAKRSFILGLLIVISFSMDMNMFTAHISTHIC